MIWCFVLSQSLTVVKITIKRHWLFVIVRPLSVIPHCWNSFWMVGRIHGTRTCMHGYSKWYVSKNVQYQHAHVKNSSHIQNLDYFFFKKKKKKRLFLLFRFPIWLVIICAFLTQLFKTLFNDYCNFCWYVSIKIVMSCSQNILTESHIIKLLVKKYYSLKYYKYVIFCCP